MTQILLLEDVAQSVLNRGSNACLFGHAGQYFKFRESSVSTDPNLPTGPYDLIHTFLPFIPGYLNQDTLAIPFFQGDLRTDQTREDLYELVQRNHFLERFALLGKGDHVRWYMGQMQRSSGKFFKFYPLKNSRPVVQLPSSGAGPKLAYRSVSRADLAKNMGDDYQFIEELIDREAAQIKSTYAR